MYTHAVSCFLSILSRLILHTSAMMTMTIARIAAPMIAKATIIPKARKSIALLLQGIKIFSP